jgi:hypothetical protein
MAAKTPSVSNDRLYDPAQPGASIPLDTPAWAAWLDAPTTTSFSYPLYNHTRGYIEGVMTVRKERRARGGAYWSAYRRCHGTLRRVYLGRSPFVLPGPFPLRHARAAAGHRRCVVRRECVARRGCPRCTADAFVTAAVVDRSG